MLGLFAAIFLMAPSCSGLSTPVDGPVVAEFAPIGRYAGHWGIDFAAPEQTMVRPSWSGVVTFAGTIAGMKSVTVAHGGGLRTSYSYLEGIDVVVGERVGWRGSLGRSGRHDGRAAVHFSVRVDSTYVDPSRYLGCPDAVSRALSLTLPRSSPYRRYVFQRATRSSRWNLRSATCRPFDRSRVRISRTRSRCRDVPSSRRSVAKTR